MLTFTIVIKFINDPTRYSYHGRTTAQMDDLIQDIETDKLAELKVIREGILYTTSGD